MLENDFKSQQYQVHIAEKNIEFVSKEHVHEYHQN